MRPALLTLTSRCLGLGCQRQTTETMEAGKRKEASHRERGVAEAGKKRWHRSV